MRSRAAEAITPVCLQVEAEVRGVNSDFVRLHGRSAAEAIDLFGRTHAVNAAPEAKTDRMPTRSSGRSSLGPKLRSATCMAYAQRGLADCA